MAVEDRLSPGGWLFVILHDIPLGRIYDATGLPRPIYQALMKLEGAYIACGVPACRAGHTLKTRAGHCPQCDTRQLAFMRRESEAGFLYVAHSRALRACKVGFSKAPWKRLDDLNRVGYAGTTDWRQVHAQPTHAGGVDERAVHDRLRGLQLDATYDREGTSVQCREVFRCAAGVAIKACRAVG